MIKKLILAVLLIVGSGALRAQMSVMVGPSIIKSFGTLGIYPGLHIGVELGQDDVQTFYGRLTICPSKSFESESGVILVAKDFNTVPYSMSLSSREKFNFTSLELGKRFYFGDGFDSGFSPYGGTNIQLVFNKIKLVTDDYDKTKYDIDGGSKETVGSIFGLYFGLSGGLKKSFYFGTLYFDAGLNYALLAVPSNNLASNTNNFRSLLFNFNIGFRKDFY